MRTKGNQLFIQILLLIVITAIIAVTCVSLTELVKQLSEAAGEILTRFNTGLYNKYPGPGLQQTTQGKSSAFQNSFYFPW